MNTFCVATFTAAILDAVAKALAVSMSTPLLFSSLIAPPKLPKTSPTIEPPTLLAIPAPLAIAPPIAVDATISLNSPAAPIAA